MRASVIDLGFNSAKMVSYEVSSDRHFRAFQQEGERVRLGEGLNETGFLGAAPIQRAIDTLTVFRDITKLEGVHHIIPVATSAVREAGNRVDFLERVRRETGLEFKVLSPRDEALYSYAGAALATRIPTSVFFDLGGGSLEIVHSDGFRIRRTLSLPLGALRLTYAYGKGGEIFSKKGYERMVERIEDLLPSRRELGVSSDAKLVGVGGNLRAMARYHQDRVRYPFEKVHNYTMNIDSIDSVARRLFKMSRNKIAEINAIGGGRAGTIVAAACVVRTLMKKLGFREIVISTHGLREGTLAMFLNAHRAFVSGAIGPNQIQEYLHSRQAGESRTENLRALRASGLINEAEARILDTSLRLDETPSTVSLQSLFFLSMDDDSWLSHREQLTMAISLVCARNENAGERLFWRYERILKRKQWRTIRRLASAGRLLRFLKDTDSQLAIGRVGDRVEMKIRSPTSAPPSHLLGETMRRVQEIFEAPISYAVEAIPRATEAPMVKHEVGMRE